MDGSILLVECPDRKGLVAAVTGVLARHDCNIVSNHEFVDPDGGGFFMRTCTADPILDPAVLAELRAVLPSGARVRIAANERRRVVLLASTEHHCLGDLLVRNAFEELPAKIVAVVSNHATLEPLVQRFGLPWHHVPHAGLERAQHEQLLRAAIEPYDPELLVLAKYMRVLTPDFVARYPARILNIHHSFLPAFAGANPYRQAHRRGVKLIGATAHFVTDELDEGPIIAQDVIPVSHRDAAAAMTQAGRDVEKVVLARALRLVCEERVFVVGSRTVIFD